MSIKINKDNYETYMKVFRIFNQQFYNLNPKLKAATIEAYNKQELNEQPVKFKKSELYSGLKQGLADIVTMMSESPTLATAVNAELIANKLPDVQQLKVLVSDSVNKVIKRQKIKNIDEYYIIKEILDDTESDITEEQRTVLNKIFAAFEEKVKDKK